MVLLGLRFEREHAEAQEAFDSLAKGAGFGNALCVRGLALAKADLKRRLWRSALEDPKRRWNSDLAGADCGERPPEEHLALQHAELGRVTVDCDERTATQVTLAIRRAHEEAIEEYRKAVADALALPEPSSPAGV
jgi:hypothetical protein